MKVLITGITGFVGSYLAEYILKEKKGVEVCGTVRWRSRRENIDHIKNSLHLIECDLKDATSVRQMMTEFKPDWIFHLAAQSFVVTSWHAPADTLMNNIMGELNIFEACRQLALSPAIQIAGSSEEYGLVHEDELPVKETHELRPMSPYGVSKVAQDLLGFQYYKSYNLPIVRTRAFNHSGPRRGDVFVESNFAKQLAEIEVGSQEPVMNVGNLEARRDYTDVRDTVKGYWLALEKGKPGEVYNVCSGKAYSVKEILDSFLKLSKVKVDVRLDPDRLRPSDVPVLVGDYTKFQKETGWKPTIPFEKTLEDIFQYWRGMVKAPA